MARSINVEANSFTEQVGKRPELFTRFNFYPPCSRPDLVLGLKEHSDGSAITIVLLDREVEGLQWRKDDQWFRVPVPAMADSLLINIGEQAEVLTALLFTSYENFWVCPWSLVLWCVCRLWAMGCSRALFIGPWRTRRSRGFRWHASAAQKRIERSSQSRGWSTRGGRDCIEMWRTMWVHISKTTRRDRDQLINWRFRILYFSK